MKSVFFKMICRLLVVSLTMMPFQAAQAGMIGTDRAAAVTSAQADRDAVLAVVTRAEVQQQLAARGIDPASAKDRVMAMTDTEVRKLASDLDSAPAGARSNGWAWAAVIIIGIIIWYNWRR